MDNSVGWNWVICAWIPPCQLGRLCRRVILRLPWAFIVVLSQAVQSVENEAGVKQSVFLDDSDWIFSEAGASWFSALEAVESSLGLCGE